MRTWRSPRILLWCLLFASMTAAAEKPIAPETIDGVTRLTAEQAIELILKTPGLVVLDSRRADEYEKGHIEGAINLLDTDMTEETVGMLIPDRATPILVYCNGERCLRSTHAATKLRAWGYLGVHWFRGGWAEWREKQYPTAH